MINEQGSPSPRSSKPDEPQSRRRLVIDLSPPGGKKDLRQRSRRWPKVVAILGMALVMVAGLASGAVYFWWEHYKTTPAYSLALLVDACQRNDTAVIDQIADTDKIVDNLAAQVTEKTVARYGAAAGPAVRRRVESLVPALLPSVKQSVQTAFAKRLQEIFEKSEPKPFVVLAIGLPYLVNISAEGDSAKVTAVGSDQRIELSLRRNGERWRVTGMKDDIVVQRIVDDIIKEFPAIGQIK
ncbi:MAG: hypothetical protein ACREBG_23010 [Pyrinomonadaceae bacterium]